MGTQQENRKMEMGGGGVEERKLKQNLAPIFSVSISDIRIFYKEENKQRRMQMFVHFKNINKARLHSTLGCNNVYFGRHVSSYQARGCAEHGGSQVPPKRRYSSTKLYAVTHPKDTDFVLYKKLS
jgi:hypothetical protein